MQSNAENNMLHTTAKASLPARPKVKMSQRRYATVLCPTCHCNHTDSNTSSNNQGTSAVETPQQPTASYWNNGQAPTWMGPLAYYNNDFRSEDMEGQFRTGLSCVLPQTIHGLGDVMLTLS